MFQTFDVKLLIKKKMIHNVMGYSSVVKKNFNGKTKVVTIIYRFVWKKMNHGRSV